MAMNESIHFLEKRMENNGQPVKFELPSFIPTPSDALLDLEYTLDGAPAIISITDRNWLLISDPTATEQTISV